MSAYSVGRLVIVSLSSDANSATDPAWAEFHTENNAGDVLHRIDGRSPAPGCRYRAVATAVSRSLKSVGPNTTLVEHDLEAVIRGLKAQLVGEISVSGPDLAQSPTDLELVDEYRLYLHPVVLGRGKPFFAGPRPPLRLFASDLTGEDVIRLTYVPA